MIKKSTPDNMTTLSSCLEKAREDGYTRDFEIRSAGLCIAGEEKCYTPREINIDNFYRFEGVSDPGDNIILYLVNAVDGAKGTITDGYGAYANSKLSDFMQEVEEIKKIKPNKT